MVRSGLVWPDPSSRCFVRRIFVFSCSRFCASCSGFFVFRVQGFEFRVSKDLLPTNSSSPPARSFPRRSSPVALPPQLTQIKSSLRPPYLILPELLESVPFAASSWSYPGSQSFTYRRSESQSLPGKSRIKNRESRTIEKI